MKKSKSKEKKSSGKNVYKTSAEAEAASPTACVAANVDCAAVVVASSQQSKEITKVHRLKKLKRREVE